jgi:hypothetical protein
METCAFCRQEFSAAAESMAEAIFYPGMEGVDDGFSKIIDQNEYGAALAYRSTVSRGDGEEYRLPEHILLRTGERYHFAWGDDDIFGHVTVALLTTKGLIKILYPNPGAYAMPTTDDGTKVSFHFVAPFVPCGNGRMFVLQTKERVVGEDEEIDGALQPERFLSMVLAAVDPSDKKGIRYESVPVSFIRTPEAQTGRSA